MDIRRIGQVIKYGWRHAGEISRNNINKSRTAVFWDILSCYKRYHLWSNQYIKEHFYELSDSERKRIGEEYKTKNMHYEEIKNSMLENRKFLNKWKSYYWELGYENRRKKRQEAYAKRYNMGKNCVVSFDVHIERNHYLDGTISIGDNVLLAKHVYIDYSGGLIIHDNVALANGVIIETHTHSLVNKKSIPIQSKLEIFDRASIYSRAFIADTCHSIGRMATIGAGSYIRSNIPPYAIVIGNPAKIVGFKMTPEEIIEFEKENYAEEDRLPLELLEKNYEKYYRSRWKEIKLWSRI